MKHKSQYCTLYLVRHGETQANVLGMFQGQVEDKNTDLNTTGIKQSQQLAKQFKPIKFAAAFSSDLLRAKRTAALILLQKKLHTQTAQALRERSFGQFEGKTLAEYQQRLKHMLDKFDQLPQAEKMSFKLASDIESGEEIITRALTFLRQIAIAYPNQKVLVVTHSGVIRHILIHLGFGNHDQLRSGTVTNAAWVKLKSDGVDFFIEATQGVNKDNVGK